MAQFLGIVVAVIEFMSSSYLKTIIKRAALMCFSTRYNLFQISRRRHKPFIIGRCNLFARNTKTTGGKKCCCSPPIYPPIPLLPENSGNNISCITLGAKCIFIFAIRNHALILQKNSANFQVRQVWEQKKW